ncbi:MAG: hypothetical protein AB7N80_08425 [Bdellovibrionales bacterium]
MDGMNTVPSLEKITAKNGDVVLKYRGRLLASAIDPRREARDWINRWRLRIAVAERLVILGAGAGFHIDEVVREWPALRVLVICCEPEVFAEMAKQQAAAWPLVDLVLYEGHGDLLSNPKVRHWMRGYFTLLEHSSLSNLQTALYQECKARLLAREPLFFSDWVRREPRLSQLFPLQAIPGGENRQMLSIKDLEKFVNVRADANPADVMIVRALRELVR